MCDSQRLFHNFEWRWGMLTQARGLGSLPETIVLGIAPRSFSFSGAAATRGAQTSGTLLGGLFQERDQPEPRSTLQVPPRFSPEW